MYDPKLALACAQACARAYDPSSDGLLADITRGDARAVVVRYGDGVIVAFRGTEPDHLQDWIEDMDTVKVPFAGAQVHAGFLSAMSLLQPGLDAFLASVTGPVYLTGHSLGGAEALLYAPTRKVAALYTFGQPRVGDAAFAAFIDMTIGDYCRLVNDCDVVPRVPNGMGYEHAGKLGEFDKDGRLSWPATMSAESWDVVADLADHEVGRYVELVGAALRAANGAA